MVLNQGYLRIAGDGNGLTAEGFELGNSPIAYLMTQYFGPNKLAMTTNHGTLAISKSSEADEVLIGAFRLIFCYSFLPTNPEDQDVLIFSCAGWKGMLTWEDSL